MDKETLHTKIVREIIAAVASGQHRSGDRLPAERVLCSRFGVSRGTLRKAIADLSELGVVAVRPNSGIYVKNVSGATLPDKFLPPDFDFVTLQDIIVARKAIELAAVELACRDISAAELKNLHALVDQMQESLTDLPRFLSLDMEFHRSLVKAGRNRVLATAFAAIYEYHRFSSVYTSQRGDEERIALDYHRQLLKAIEKHNIHECRKILAGHLERLSRYGKSSRKKSYRKNFIRHG